MRYLLDANVLIARTTLEHVHRRSAIAWLERNPDFAVCPITEAALMRFVLRAADGDAGQAIGLSQALRRLPGYAFWPADLSCADVDWRGLIGYRQVTGAYLVALAEARSGRLATFDRGLAALHPAAELIPLVD